MKYVLLLSIISIVMSFTSKGQNKTTGTFERLDPGLDSIISRNAKAEIIAEGFEWSEGPLWIDKGKMLLFSDVPANTIYKWTAEKGTEVYLQPSGYTGSIPSTCKEPGSNGLVLHKGDLVLCQHGDRKMVRMDAPLSKPAAKFINLADMYHGKRLSSPNDAVYRNDELFFTDPPYGLNTQNDSDPKKEIAFNGVYRVSKDGQVSLVTDALSRPNGLAFFPGGNKLLVANSDSKKPNWYLLDVNPDGKETTPQVFYSLEGYDKKLKGLPDGLKIDRNGNVFATGPGGLYILNSQGKLLGKFKLENAASNCALSPDEKTLYITNDMYVLKFKMRD